MSEAQKHAIKETVDMLKKLDENGIAILNSNAQVLLARQRLDEKKSA